MNIEKLIYIAVGIYTKKSPEVKDLLIHIEAMNDLIAKGAVHNDFGLNEIEILALIMLEEFAYKSIQQPAFNDIYLNDYNEILINSLDNALLKIPRTSHDTLYRQDRDYYKIPENGEILKFKGFFTTSKDDFDNTDNIKWVIKPLPNGLTKAHDIYLVYNKGYNLPYPEWQVEFERNTKFIVTKVVPKDNFTEVYISELED
ncbi:MAG: hypothetical protein J6C56_01100 [Alistipes sp.]|nr:hypothetical protein [Alistipes sp.]